MLNIPGHTQKSINMINRSEHILEFIKKANTKTYRSMKMKIVNTPVHRNLESG